MNAPPFQVSIAMKSTGIAYLLWLFFGGIGAHKFYLGRPLIGGLYILLFVLFWVGVIRLMTTGADIVADAVAVAVQQANPTIGAAARRFANPTLGRIGLGTTWMTVPLSLALLFDLITLPAQVRAANSRLASETSSYRAGSAATSFSRFDDDRSESERFAQADEAVARYKAQLTKAAASPERVAAVAGAGPPTFGKRR
jgi:TM2 domain-containing membrane protein YozV